MSAPLTVQAEGGGLVIKPRGTCWTVWHWGKRAGWPLQMAFIWCEAFPHQFNSPVSQSAREGFSLGSFFLLECWLHFLSNTEATLTCYVSMHHTFFCTSPRGIWLYWLITALSLFIHCRHLESGFQLDFFLCHLQINYLQRLVKSRFFSKKKHFFLNNLVGILYSQFKSAISYNTFLFSDCCEICRTEKVIFAM